MFRLAALYILLLISCTAPNRIISYTARTVPVYKVDPPPQKILVLNVYDIAAKKYRDNKEELFISLSDELMNWASGKINEFSGIPSQVLKGYTKTAGNTDSTVYAIIKQQHATHAIVIDAFDISFIQTHVEVVKDYSGKKDRTAYYDIEADIGYSFYTEDSLFKKSAIHNSWYHSSRTVLSGLLAAGPNVVVQRDDARKIMLANGQQYLNYFFPGEVIRNRLLFTGKGFESVRAAINKNDYEAAMIESLRITNEPDKEKASKGFYNCAVLSERKNQIDEAKSYLRQSLSSFNLREARIMQISFEK